MPPHVVRSVPALLAGVLLVAASAPYSHTSPAPGNGPAVANYTATCGSLIQSVTTGQPLTWSGTTGLTQPVTGAFNIAGDSLAMNLSGATWGSTVIHSVVPWDPVALAPSSVTVALRSTWYDLSGLYWWHGRLSAAWTPPVVRQEIERVAEGMPGPVALDWLNVNSWVTASTFADTAESGAVPIAYAYASGGPRLPLPGSHGALEHMVCAGDPALDAMYVTQSVIRTDSLMDSSHVDIVQRFRVPVSTTLHWVELAAAATYPMDFNQVASISVIDAGTLAPPPVTLPSPMVQANLSWFTYGVPEWISHMDFDHTISLVPGHDYWLVAHSYYSHRFYTRLLTGTEDANFTSHIGPLWVRSPNGWVVVPNHVLDFRLIGVVSGDAGVPASHVVPRFELRALANPAHGAVLLAWSGARGALAIDVLDVRGRRVGGGTAAAAAAGRWLWTATRADGAPLAAGVYFVRARDASGAEASERVVLVR